jgi:hypothetical protein
MKLPSNQTLLAHPAAAAPVVGRPGLEHLAYTMGGCRFEDVLTFAQ